MFVYILHDHFFIKLCLRGWFTPTVVWEHAQKQVFTHTAQDQAAVRRCTSILIGNSMHLANTGVFAPTKMHSAKVPFSLVQRDYKICICCTFCTFPCVQQPIEMCFGLPKTHLMETRKKCASLDAPTCGKLALNQN